MVVQFLIHNKGDDVGVATSDLKKGTEVEGAYLDTNEKLKVKAQEDIPLGHKIALKDMKKGHELVEYKNIIGSVVQDIATGQHVHTHNLKSKRWK
ncbi:MAG: UxaA family hydrolase [Thermoplasmata archaeon]